MHWFILMLHFNRIIKVVRGGIPLQGRLTVLLTEGIAANPLWLIQYENNKEEELYEAAFGKLIKSANGGKRPEKVSVESKSPPEEALSRQKSHTPTTTATAPSIKKVKLESASQSSSSAGDESKKKSVTFSRDNSLSDDSEQLTEEQKKKNKSDREQRSLRRQAMVQVPGSDVVPPANNNNSNNKRRPPPKSNSTHLKKRPKLEDEKVGGEVVKVKLVLLTGTLFLYRGANGQRRAEFVRRV